MTDGEGRWERAAASARQGAERARRRLDLLYARPVGRAVRRYVDNNGNVLAGGVAYYSLASIAAAIVLAVTVASYIVTGSDAIREAVFEFIGNAIPGIFPTEDSPGLVDPRTLTPTAMSGVLGLVAFGVLVFTATRYMRGMRAATRAMLGRAAATSIPGTVRDIIVLIGIVVISVLGTALQFAAGVLAETVAGWLGDGTISTVTVRAAAFIAGLIVDAAFVALVLLVLGRARAGRRVLWTTIGATAFVIAVLQQASGYFVSSAASSPVLAPFAAIIALLLFVDLTTRVLLIAAAWLGVAADVDD